MSKKNISADPLKKDLISPFLTRQHMISKHFELFYYCLHPDTEIASHTHDYYEFYFFIEGNMVIEFENTSMPIQSGDFLIIPPHTPHRARLLDNTTPYRRFVLWISIDYYNHLTLLSEDYTYLFEDNKVFQLFSTDTITFNTIQSHIFQLLEEINSNRFGKEIQIRLSLDSLMLFLCRHVYESQYPHTFESSDLCTSIAHYIQNHLSDSLTLDDLASYFFLNKYYLSHTFKENYGLSIHQYIIKMRVKACRTDLLYEKKPSEVYETYGFRDYSVFYRAFKKEYGISPTEFLKTIHVD